MDGGMENIREQNMGIASHGHSPQPIIGKAQKLLHRCMYIGEKK